MAGSSLTKYSACSRYEGKPDVQMRMVGHREKAGERFPNVEQRGQMACFSASDSL